ncbi:MAG TPA: TMEM175 family protein [Acidimicrobiia bacterium]
MTTSRLEAFSDAVIAIVITIMVLELKVPHGAHLRALRPLVPVFLTYVLSFVYLGIYWNNHHHLLQRTDSVSGGILWANLHLLFWLSLFPFATGWWGENHFATTPTVAYGVVLLCAGIAYYTLQSVIVARQGSDSALARALGFDAKGKASMILYAIAIGLAIVNRWIAVGIYVFVALIWLIPDRRLERGFTPPTQLPGDDIVR